MPSLIIFLIFIAVDLLVKVYSMCLCVGEDVRVVLPDVGVVLVMLVAIVVGILLSSLLAPLTHSEVDVGSFQQTHLIQVVVVGRIIYYPPLLFLPPYQAEIYLFGHTPLYVLERLHDVGLAPI